MNRFDVCNGDADGLCAVLQWRLHAPASATLVTGLKREIELLADVQAAADDEVLVCDLSIDRNAAALERLLERGVHVRWFDHHAASRVPCHPALEATIEAAPDVCASLLVDRALHGTHRSWALVGAYGDNLASTADTLGAGLGLDASRRACLRRLGEALNYNAYGDDEHDVRIHPRALYPRLAAFRDPLDFVARDPLAAELDALRRSDLQRAYAVAPCRRDEGGSVTVLPDAAWARRVVGAYANELAQRERGLAHALLQRGRGGGWRVSVRAPLDAPHGAQALCHRFGGSGRAAAAGIDHLGDAEVDRFIRAFAANRWEAPC